MRSIRIAGKLTQVAAVLKDLATKYTFVSDIPEEVWEEIQKQLDEEQVSTTI